MSKSSMKQAALDYHSKIRPGKIEVIPTKNTKTQRDLSLAYSPGVAEPCLAIAENIEDVYKYTAKGNLVAVISNGTAVLGLGDIGPEASKPVMEGKGLLFKIYADIDCFDIEINSKTADEFVATVKALEPTFGGINLEDIKAPECFEIETRLKKELNIPIMHDDQHGTAIVSSAALLNALEIAGKEIGKVKVVVNGAGASAISCSKLYLALGVNKDNLLMFDSKGLIHTGRTDLDENKRAFASTHPPVSLVEAMVGADVFLGLSKGNTVSKEMVSSMGTTPIVFALANPDPEITYDDAKAAREDAIVATGRSDYPNQVNNVLGFPFIFRGALDVRAREINEPMKLAAAKALAELTKEHVPDNVNKVYNDNNISFGPEYIIPKPIDPRLITTVAVAVAKAAIESGVARNPITDWDAYKDSLERRMGREQNIMRTLTAKAKRAPKRVVFTDADNHKILKAAQIVREEGICEPILLGNAARINALMESLSISLEGVQIYDPWSEVCAERRNQYAELLFKKRQRKGMTLYDAHKAVRDRAYYGAMMVECGDADAMISGLTKNYSTSIRPALHVMGMQPGVSKVAGMYIIMTKNGPLFLADTTVTPHPTVEDIVNITELSAKEIQKFNITPRIALLSYSNFGSSKGPEPEIMQKAVTILKQKYPTMIVDGEMQANFAMDKQLMQENFPFSDLVKDGANTLIFPNLSSGNMAYKLLQTVAGFESIGPILLGLKKPMHILQLGSGIREIVNMITIAVVDAQRREEVKS